MGQSSKRAAQLKPFSHYQLVRYAAPLAQVLDPTTSSELLVKELTYDSSRCSVSDLEQMLQRKMMLQHENIASLKDYYVDQGGQGSRSPTTTAVLLYYLPFGTLENQKVQRAQEQSYRESELWSILKGIVLGFSYLQRNGIKHECVRLSTIYLSQAGVVKVSDPQITRQDTNYQLFLHDRNARVPLSPKQLESALHNMPNIVYDPFKSDVYCAGVVMLQLIEPREQLPQTGTQAYSNYILKGISTCSSKFSNQLTQVLRLMLEPNEDKRMDWNSLEKLIESCQDRRKSHDCTSSIKTAIFPEEQVAPISSPVGPTPTIPIANIPTLPIFQRVSAKVQQPTHKQNGAQNPEITRTRSPFSQGAGTPSNPTANKQGWPPLGKPLSTRQALSQQPSTPSIASQPRIGLPPPPTPGPSTRLNHSISQSLKAGVVSQPNPIIKSNRIMASNINREKSLGRASEVSPADSFHSSSYNNPAKQSTMSVTSVSSARAVPTNPPGFTGIPPISFSFQSAKTVKPLTCLPSANHFSSLKEETKETLSSKVVERLGNQTPINSIIVQDKAAFQMMVANEEEFSILPSTFQKKSQDEWKQNRQKEKFFPKERLQQRVPQEESEAQVSFDKKLHAVRSFRDLHKSDPIIEVLPLNPPPDLRPEQLLRLVPDRHVSSTIHEASSQFSASNQISILLERIPVQNISDIKAPLKVESKFLGQAEIKELTQGTQSKMNDRSAERHPVSLSVDAAEWSTLFRKNQGSKISVEIQTSPKRSISPTRKPHSPVKARVSEGGQMRKYMDSSSRTVRHEAPIKIQPKYEGSMLRGFRHGYGKYTFEDGGFYEGEWAFNRMQGKGKLFYASGRLAYEGDWSQDQIHGYGTLYNQNPRYVQLFDYKDFSKVGNYWSTYEGSFEFDMKNGNGTLTLCNGQTYSGHFEADKVHGEGIFRGKNRLVHGLWQCDLIKSIL